MNPLLIANLGNRNLLFSGELFDGSDSERNTGSKLFGKQLNFKDLSILLLEDIKNGQHNVEIKLNILDAFFENGHQAFSGVKLIGSDQVNAAKQDQDTYWEALIIKYLIEKDYKVECEIEKYEGNVTDNNSLLKFYTSLLNQYKIDYPGVKKIICDAGGTAQQKAALKIAAEFILGKDEFEVYYKPINSDILELVNQYEYRKIIVSEQIKSLIEHGNYSGALQVLHDLDDWELYSDLRNLLVFGKFRMDSLYEEINIIGRKSFQKIPVPELLDLYKRKTPVCSVRFQEIFGSELKDPSLHAFHVSELYYIVDFYQHDANYTEMVLSLAIFIESFTTHYVSSHTGINLLTEYQLNSDKFIRLLNDEYPEVNTVFSFRPTSLSLPVILAVAGIIARNNKDKFAAELIYLLQSFNKEFSHKIVAIDELRNKIAHKGEGVKERDLKKLFDQQIFDKLKGLISNSGISPYTELNNLIVGVLHRN